MLRDGIFSPWTRVLAGGSNSVQAITQRDAVQLKLLSVLHKIQDRMSWIQEAQPRLSIQPSVLLAQMGKNIENDIAFLPDGFSQRHPEAQVEGPQEKIFIHHSATVSRHSVLDSTGGPIVIDAGVRIGAFCHISGPAYVGPKTQLDACFFSHTIAGENCRLGGEISECIVGDFSNKHHEGFLGHSLVGDWVNLGALTTTSDLKNNYGEIKLTFSGKDYPTGEIKFGSIIGDHVKTAIGTMLNTGTIVDAGTNLFGTPGVSGYVAPLTWGSDRKYDKSKFAEHAARMMRRRGQGVAPELRQLFDLI
jgi:UDP-N-acetylglucosamine diphosphorylase/glucosamine-1-phosphate N-acetyltransferase